MATGWSAGVLVEDVLRVGSFAGGDAAASDITLAPARRVELLAHFSGAFDLAESQPVGHACRVAHFALGIAGVLGLTAAERRRVLSASLLHDAGVAVRTGAGHLDGGAWVAERFGLDEGVSNAIRHTHERWDGQGRPNALAGAAIPVESLIVSAAHWASDQVEGPDNPLRARTLLQRACPRDVEPYVGPEISAALSAVLRDDRTWIAMWSPKLPALVAAAGSGEGRPSLRNVEAAAAAMGEVIDAAIREPGRARRVADLAVALGEGLDLPLANRRALSLGGHLADIGQLGVPRHITEKPSILSVEEMEQMRRHPGLGGRMLESAPGLDGIGAWIEGHHERPDGRGYPAMLGGAEIALEARILAVADAYCALRADRPFRSALSRLESVALVRAGAGTQFDHTVVGVLPAALDACEPRWAREPEAVPTARDHAVAPAKVRRGA
ncbi:MAG: HD domain-containing protein [Chloroflexi bacterium]|nr:HD domain-containing protein [Chloroflexota bacterium]MDA1003745.1 HD domain-containing protein [Chloroflexota bacterium]